MRRVVVIGAGVGGLSAAALLARAGIEVTVLEAHIYPGGCAATFPRQGYRFDAGATVAAGFYPGGPFATLAERLDLAWALRPAGVAMTVHLPGRAPVVRWTEPSSWREERRQAFGPAAEPFWHWQERTANLLWDLALRRPPWPPRSAREMSVLVGYAREALWRAPGLVPGLATDALLPLGRHLAGTEEPLRLFVDAQLLIAAQTTSRSANALYAAAALDLPRRGVAHLQGGMGAIAEALAAAVVRFGGQVVYRQEAVRIRGERGRPVAVETKQGDSFAADAIVANLTPAGLASLVAKGEGPRRSPSIPADGWGAFVVYAGIEGSAVPEGLALHHQVVVAEPLAEGNTAFLSLSPGWDETRAPVGKRALTISTHTAVGPWWQALREGRAAYEALRARYVERLLGAAKAVIPGLREAAEVLIPGTPVTFARFTRRPLGWVGGWPQTNLLRMWSPRVRPGIWLVGDSVFPGQSVASVALAGMRVADDLIAVANGLPEAPYRLPGASHDGRISFRTRDFLGGTPPE